MYEDLSHPAAPMDHVIEALVEFLIGCLGIRWLLAALFLITIGIWAFRARGAL
jgi:hypothetical protein